MASIFTKIINKELPSHLIKENDIAIAFMDINPISRGHVLVVPKIEVDYLFDLNEEIYNELWLFTRKIASGLKSTIDCKRIGVSVVGFDVAHAHIHLIPINAVSDMNFSNKIQVDHSSLELMAQEIAANIY